MQVGHGLNPKARPSYSCHLIQSPHPGLVCLFAGIFEISLQLEDRVLKQALVTYRVVNRTENHTRRHIIELA